MYAFESTHTIMGMTKTSFIPTHGTTYIKIVLVNMVNMYSHQPKNY